MLNVPLFTPLLSLLSRYVAADADSAVVRGGRGVLAVVVQWYGTEHVGQRSVRRAFRTVLIVAFASVLLLMLARAAFVVDVPIEGRAGRVAFAVRWNRLPTCPCASPSDALCIGDTLTFNPALIEICGFHVPFG